MTEFSDISFEESMIPIRPGIPGKQPFWNRNSKRFIYAPAFDFKEIPGVKKYQFITTADSDSQSYSFESEKPWHRWEVTDARRQENWGSVNEPYTEN